MSSAVKWLKRWHESKSAVPKPRGGSVSPLEEFAEQILDLIAQQPDLTLVETVAELRKRRIRTSRSSLWRFPHRHGITLKKLQAAERQRADVARARRRWIREQGGPISAWLAFIDETAVSTNLARVRGRAPSGDSVALFRLEHGRRSPSLLPCAKQNDRPNGGRRCPDRRDVPRLYRACLIRRLVYRLVVMETGPSHGAHHSRGDRESARRLRDLSKYSPDLNPIELPYSKFKAFLRRVARERFRASLEQFALRPTDPSRECANYFRHEGYASI